MRLLLTRAADDAGETRRKLEAAGHRVLVSPVIAIVGRDAVWPAGVIDGLVATSAQAFRVAMAGGPMPEARRLLPLHLVGARTEEAARAAGFSGAATVAKTSAALADAFREVRSPAERLLYLAGADRKPELERAFESLEPSLDVIETYAAHPVDGLTEDTIRAWRQGAIDGVLHFSRRSAALLLAAARKSGLDVEGPAHFCLSEDVAVPLREAGRATIEVAPEPREADLLALIGPS